MTDMMAGSEQTEGMPSDPTHRSSLRSFEDSVLVVALLAIVILPLAEIVLRKLAGVGISGSAALVQHLTLIVSMLGAAVAARDSRLLSLATTTFLPEGFQRIAAIVSGIVATCITAFLAVGSAQFVWTERAGGAILAYSIPIWIVQLVLPAGFALIALRIVWNASKSWPARTLVVVGTAALCLLFYFSPPSVTHLAVPALIVLFIAAILGAPIFVILGGAALILFWREGVPIAAVAVDHYSLVVNPSLPAIPLFTLAGYLLAEGGASKRLVDVFTTVFGRVRGGPAIVTALAAALTLPVGAYVAMNARIFPWDNVEKDRGEGVFRRRE